MTNLIRSCSQWWKQNNFLTGTIQYLSIPSQNSSHKYKKAIKSTSTFGHPVFVVAENNSVGHSQHSSLMPCMTEPIVRRKQRSGKPGFWDVNDWEIYDQFVRHIRRERAKWLMQQNVLPRSLSTNNLLYFCDANHATVNNFDESSSDASVETEMWTYDPYMNFVWTIQPILCDTQSATGWDAT